MHIHVYTPEVHNILASFLLCYMTVVSLIPHQQAPEMVEEEKYLSKDHY